MNADQLRQLDAREILERLRDQVDVGLSIVESGRLVETAPLPDLTGKPLIRIGDFTIFARDEMP